MSPNKDLNINTGSEAEAYVDSIMASQRITRVDTPQGNGRKRHLSLPSARNIIVTQADVHQDYDPSVKQLIAKMSSDMHMMFTSLAERIEKLEEGLEQRISSKVAQLLDKRVYVELGRIKKDIDTRLDTFKETLREDLADSLEEITVKRHTNKSNKTLAGLNIPMCLPGIKLFTAVEVYL